jgi:hypothetical protein
MGGLSWGAAMVMTAVLSTQIPTQEMHNANITLRNQVDVDKNISG